MIAVRLIAVTLALGATILSCRIAPRYAGRLDAECSLDAASPDTERDSRPADTAAHPATAVPLGVYHVREPVDAVSLSLNPDSSFHWTLCGCDFALADVGVWYEEDGANRLLPLPWHWQLPLTWWLLRGFSDIKYVVLKPTSDPDKLEATVVADSFTETQHWYRGRRCVECGAMGPKGDAPCKSEVLPILPCSP